MSGGLGDRALFERPGPFVLESGATLPSLTIAYHTWGTLAPGADNAVVVAHALTGSPDVDAWWPGLLGPGHALDPARDFIVCANVLGSPYGSSGPASQAPTGGRWGARFPAVTVRDVVRAQGLLLDALGVREVRLAIGGSLGGMLALEWALIDPRVRAAAVIAAPARHEAWAIAWSDAQRRALAADPAWHSDRFEAVAGLAAARAIAMLSYRAPQSLAARFGRERGGEGPFAVRDWLGHHGVALVRRFDAASYGALLDLMDTHDVGTGRGGVGRALAALHRPVLVVGIPSDQLYPAAELEALAAALPAAELRWLDSPHGHDAFLIDQAQLDGLVRAFRARLAAAEATDVTELRAAEGAA